jgi:hypothetical protein
VLDATPDAALAGAGRPVERLQALLETPRPALVEEALAEARAAGPGPVADLVGLLVERALTPGQGMFAAVRAVRLAGELRLEAVAPALARCLEASRGKEDLRQAALGSLARLGRPGAEALLDAFERCQTMMDRSELAELLVVVDACDDRVRGALLRVVDELPEYGAGLLLRRGDWRAVPELLRRIDHLALAPLDDCTLCAGLAVEALEAVVRALGGVLTDEQRQRIDRVLDGEGLRSFPRAGAPRGHPPVRILRAGRNAPCPCGSGRKYKKCCLAADERRGAH